MLMLKKEADESLSKFVTEQGVLAAEQYDEAVKENAVSAKGVINICIEKGYVNEDQIADALSNHHKFDKIEFQSGLLENRPFREELTDHFIVKNRVVPFRENDNAVAVLLADPLALKSIAEIQSLTGREVDVYVTTLSALEKYMQEIPKTTDKMGKGGAKDVLSPKEAFMQALAKKESGTAAVVENKKLPVGVGGLGGGMPSVTAGKSGSGIIDFVNNMIEGASALGASDVHVEDYEGGARLRFRCDGVLREMKDYSDFLTDNYSAITTRIKILASLDISERRLPQDGGISFQMEGKKIDIRVSILPTNHGEKIVMRLIDKEAANYTMDDLGLSEENYAKMKKAIYSPQGMILVTGPTGSGKSTTLYAGLKTLNTPELNIMTAEDPVEFDLDGINQVPVKDSIGLSFSAALRSFLRQDPEVIMVGEIRDKDTGDIAIKAALTGHLVFSTLHTNDAISTITRMINMGIPSYLITSALMLVIAQRLGRLICKNCIVDDPDHPMAEFTALGFTEEEAKELKPKKGTGCDKCFNTGAKGRRAIHEMLVATPALREAILNEANEIEMRKVAQKDGFETMQQAGRRLIAEGLISIEEYKRILIVD